MRILRQVIRGKSVTELIQDLSRNRSNPKRVARTLVRLARYGAEASESIPTIINSISMVNPTRNRQIVQTLLVIAESARIPVIEHVLPLLVDSNRFSEERYVAAEVLGEIGQGSESVLSALIEGVQGNNLGLQWECIKALAKMGKREIACPVIVEALHRHLEPPDTISLLILLRTLNTIGPDASALPALVSILKANRVYGYGPTLEAVSAIAAIESAAADKRAVEALIGTVSDYPTGTIPIAVERTLAAMGPSVVAQLVYELSELRWGAQGTRCKRITIIRVLGAIGPRARDAVPILIEQWRGGGDDFKWPVLNALEV